MAKNKSNRADYALGKLTSNELFELSNDIDGAFITDRVELILIEIYETSNYNLRLVLSNEVRKEMTKRLRSLCVTIIPRM